MIERNRKKDWTVIIIVALLLHAILFMSIRPEFFSAFRKTLSDTMSPGDLMAPGADVIVTIPIEIEDSADDSSEQNPVQDRQETSNDRHRPPPDKPPSRPPATKGTNAKAIDIETLTGHSPETLPQNTAPQGLTIPPRPIEITWPDTRRLQHCLDHQIDVSIEVDENGRVVDVKTGKGEHPSDCVQAAVESARHIVFEPGEVDGVPTRMWTQIRIDFRKKQ